MAFLPSISDAEDKESLKDEDNEAQADRPSHSPWQTCAKKRGSGRSPETGFKCQRLAKTWYLG